MTGLHIVVRSMLLLRMTKIMTPLPSHTRIFNFYNTTISTRGKWMLPYNTPPIHPSKQKSSTGGVCKSVSKCSMGG
jgi:hypothetical protein